MPGNGSPEFLASTSDSPLAGFSLDLQEDPYVPPVPQTLDQTGLAPSLIEQLILKVLYFQGETLGRDLADALGLKFSLIDDIMEFLKRTRLVEVKRSSGYGNVSAVFAISEAGRGRAREYLELNQYNGRAPVPLKQYTEAVRKQCTKEGWLTKEALAQAFSHMVINDLILTKMGPAVNGGRSLLLYGQPGNGKTYMAEALNKLEGSCIYIPCALEVHGMIIQVFDPIHHRRIEQTEDTPSAIAGSEPRYDGRWVRCRRPFIVTGGELTLDMLDLSYNPTAKLYDAPFQVKANNGIYLIDDFGRQKATPAELLNRWIIPMDRRVDYLSFHTGGKMEVPFEAFLLFSTNLHPATLGDEALLRRIQYKMFLKNPSEEEFVEIFDRYCLSANLYCPRGMLDQFIERHYRGVGKGFRRCHPRDVIDHALDLMRFEKLPFEINDEVLDRAFESCFLESSEINE